MGQIQASAIRRLRHGTRVVNYPAVKKSDIQNTEEQIKQLKNECNILNKALGDNKKAGDKQEGNDSKAQHILEVSIKDMGFTTRTRHRLIRSGKRTVKDLTEMIERDYRRIANIGNRSFGEVITVLGRYGLSIREG